MPIRFADILQMLRVTDPRSGTRLCEAQHVQSMRMPLNRIGMNRSSRREEALTDEPGTESNSQTSFSVSSAGGENRSL